MKEIAPGYYEFSEEIRRLLANKGRHTLLHERVMENSLTEFGEETVFLLSVPGASGGDHHDIEEEYLCKAAAGNIDLVLYVVPKGLIDPLL